MKHGQLYNDAKTKVKRKSKKGEIMNKVFINGIVATQNDIPALCKHIDMGYAVRTQTNRQGDLNIIADRVFAVTPLARATVKGMEWASQLKVVANA